MRGCIFAIILTAISCSLFAQGIEEWAATKHPVIYEKVYLHIDRELYSTGDTVWFKAYLVSGMTNKLIPGYKNIYVDLVSPAGKVIANRLLLSINGESNGDLSLPRSLPDGQYTARAYTSYLKNFGERSYFHKRIWVLKPKNSTEIKTMDTTGSHLGEVMFFPEGGNMVLNAANRIAFKAINNEGKGMDVSGKVVDGAGNLITTFKTRFLGMGAFTMMPQEGETYYARINGHPEFTYQFNNIRDNTVSLRYRDFGDSLIVELNRNFKTSGRQAYYLAATHKGVVLFYRTLNLNNFSKDIVLAKNLFPLGITKITIFDSELKIVAERLVFINNKYRNTVDIETDRKEYATREKVNLSVEPVLDKGDTMISALSVSVVNEDFFSKVGNNQTIESYLLVDSELKGGIEFPALYFTDDDNITSAEKLDLLMMVQGWRSYYWDDIVKKAPKDLKGWDDVGITIQGHVKRLFHNKPVIGGNVVLGPFSKRFLFEITQTDSSGNFRFKRLYIRDKDSLMLNVKNKHDRSNTGIIPDPAAPRDSLVSADSINRDLPDISIPTKYYRASYYRNLAIKEFTPEEGAILLNEVNVYAKHKEQEFGLSRLYSEPDNTVKVTEDDALTYLNIFDYLKGRFAGVMVTGEAISIRGGKTPLFVLDNIPCLDPENMVYNMPLTDIDRIDILKGASTSVFGSQGADGVIAIYTKQGDNTPDKNPYVRGRIILQINGFQKPDAFYSPRYTPSNRNRPEPDYRPTLYWSPHVWVKEGKADIAFFTCDNISRYVVFVEGISKNGEICFGEKRFGVTRVNAAVNKSGN